jgi:hypothetical protein
MSTKSQIKLKPGRKHTHLEVKERRNAILKKIITYGGVDILNKRDLAKEFGIHERQLYRDLDAISEELSKIPAKDIHRDILVALRHAHRELMRVYTKALETKNYNVARRCQVDILQSVFKTYEWAERLGIIEKQKTEVDITLKEEYEQVLSAYNTADWREANR